MSKLSRLLSVIMCLLIINFYGCAESGSDNADTTTDAIQECRVYADANVLPGGDGSYNNPYPSIGYAIAYRDTCDNIVLKPGVYDELVNFAGAPIHLRSEKGPAVTSIKPAVGGDVVTFNSDESADTILEGVTITGGTSHAIVIDNAAPTIINCVITGNVGAKGAGVSATNYNGTFRSNTLSGNDASADGGAMSVIGGSPVIKGNWFENNNSDTYGGALYLRATALVVNNVFLGNGSDSIYLDYYTASIYDRSSIINNTIVDSVTYGVRIDTSGTPQSRFINNIINNSGNYDVYSSSSYVFSNIAWYNNNVYGTAIRYSAHDQTESNGNISQPPQFSDKANGDFTLVWGSWSIDSGKDVSSDGVIDDYLGTYRPKGLGYDMGAYESY